LVKNIQELLYLYFYLSFFIYTIFKYFVQQYCV